MLYDYILLMYGNNVINVLPCNRTDDNCTLVRLNLDISMYFVKAVGQAQEVFIIVLGYVVLFCATVVYITPTKQRKFYLQMLLALPQSWIFLSGSCQHPTRSCVFHLHFYILLSIYYKNIKSGCLI